MMSRWAIFFSVLAAAGSWAATSAATFSGQVQLRDSREKSVDREHDYSGVVIWLEPVSARAADPTGPLKATMAQKNKKFIPHVLAVRRGTAIDFPNQDPIFHNAFSNFSGQIFDIGLYKPGSSRTVAFNRSGVVRVFCNIHSAMSAIIVVVDSPWYTTTGADGAFRIQNVPPGEYRMRVFHERADVDEMSKRGKSVTVGAEGASGVQVVISESGYLPAPHLDKHGKPYTSNEDNYRIIK